MFSGVSGMSGGVVLRRFPSLHGLLCVAVTSARLAQIRLTRAAQSLSTVMISGPAIGSGRSSLSRRLCP